jgi:predicted RNA binding protein YcfA (HicA-like mRNA interferase family)
MPKTKAVTARELQRILSVEGFVQTQTKGSHERWTHQDGRRVTLLGNVREYKLGTLRSIYRQADLKWPP